MLNSDLLDRIKLPFRKEKELFSALRDILGFYPHNIELYKLALMPKSAAKRNDKGKPLNNERLEFLGDAILDAVVGDIVYRHFEGKREGFLTNTRSKLVQRDTLNKLAHDMGIEQLLRTSQKPSAHNSYMGGNAFEALVGAIYLDRGYDACMRFMQKRILSQLINIDKVAYKEVNFKSKLIEWCQKNRVKLVFSVVSEGKDDKGSPVFVYEAQLEGVPTGRGRGYSKKESQQQASKESLQRLRREPQLIDSIFAAKASRTKMEEEPTTAPPAAEAADEPATDKGEATPTNAATVAPLAALPAPKADKRGRKTDKPQDDEFDLSDITHNPAEPSREEIIALAEAQAYAGEE